MAKAIAAYEGGINQLGQAAIRADGALFKRTQFRGAYGYTWTAWKRAGSVDVGNIPASVPHGFSNLYRSEHGYMSRVRLPNN